MEHIRVVTLITRCDRDPAPIWMVHKRGVEDKNECDMITGCFSAAKNLCKEFNRKFIDAHMKEYPQYTEEEIIKSYDIPYF